MSSRVADLLAELAERGITLRPAGALLGVSPRSALTPELVSRIRQLKAELLSLLAASPLAPAAGPTMGATPTEFALLLAIARRPGLRRNQLASSTHLERAALDRALAALLNRREIALGAGGGYHLVLH